MSNIDYAAFIADLEAKRAVLQYELKAIDAALDGARILSGRTTVGPDAAPPLATAPNIITSRFANSTIPQAAEAVLRETGRPLSTRQIHDTLISGGFKSNAANLLTTIGSVLNRHSKEVGRVRRVVNGWGLAEWKLEEKSIQQVA